MNHRPGMHGKFSPNHKMSSMKKASFEVALKAKKQIAEGTMAFTFEKPEKFKFRAGQHIRMTLIDPPETDGEGNSRFFSVASTPQDKDLVFAMRMRDTAFKRTLGRMQIGDKVLIQILIGVPHGAFALHDDAVKSPTVFIVGGIGIVPAYSMIKDATERKLPHKMVLFYSNRRPEDAAYLAELEKLAKQNPNFKLIAIVTEPEKAAKVWRGETGHVDSSLLKKYADDLQSTIYYVSGLPDMVSTMQTLLADLGVNKDNVQAEEFTGFNLNEIHGTTNRNWKNHAVFLALALAIVALIIVHVTGAQSVFHGGLGSLSITNPLSYLTIGFILAIISIKLKLFSMGFRHGMKRKSGAYNNEKGDKS